MTSKYFFFVSLNIKSDICHFDLTLIEFGFWILFRGAQAIYDSTSLGRLFLAIVVLFEFNIRYQSMQKADENILVQIYWYSSFIWKELRSAKIDSPDCIRGHLYTKNYIVQLLHCSHCNFLVDLIISILTESAIIWANSSEIQSGVSPSLLSIRDPVLKNSPSLFIWASSAAFKFGEKRNFLFRLFFPLERVDLKY